MATYLLDGISFHDKLKELRYDIDSTVMYIDFSYTPNVEGVVEHLESIDVDSNGNGDIKACATMDGAHVYIYSDDDIFCRNACSMFYGMSRLCNVGFDNFDASECLDMSRMFLGCTSIGYIDMENVSTPMLVNCIDMFSGCISCYSLNIKSMSINASTEVSGMFYNTKSLRMLSIGDSFAYNPSMGLSNPDSSIIKGTNGRWNLLSTGNSYSVPEFPSKVPGTYYAVDVKDESNDDSLITVGCLRSALVRIANALSKQAKNSR